MNRTWLMAIILAIHGKSSGMQQEAPPTPPISPKDVNFKFKQCLTLEQMALKLDAIYLQTKTLADAHKVETGYLKAIKCFLEEYEKNKNDALFHVIKMWNLLLQAELEIELEKKKQKQDYEMPSEIKKLAEAVKALWVANRDERNVVSLQQTKKQAIQKLYNLRRSLDKLMQPLSPSAPQDSPNEKSDLRKASLPDTGSLNFRQGSLLYNQAKKAVSLDQSNTTLQLEEFVAGAENMYIDALRFFIAAYNEDNTDALAGIIKTVKNILDLERTRSEIEFDAYMVNPGYLELQESLIIIKENEKKRQNEKKLSLPQINPAPEKN